jgi:hypothetical protein
MTTARSSASGSAARSLLAGESLVLADGTIWSHAATLGTRVKGDSSRSTARPSRTSSKSSQRAIRRRSPSTTSTARRRRIPRSKLRAQGQVPKAGDVLELRGVFSVADFTGDLKAAAEKLSAQAKRPLDDPRNFGLWMRWKPTARALAGDQGRRVLRALDRVRRRLAAQQHGEGQGPTPPRRRLVMRPFLDDMLPVAASRDDDDRAGGSGSTTHRRER